MSSRFNFSIPLTPFTTTRRRRWKRLLPVAVAGAMVAVAVTAWDNGDWRLNLSPSEPMGIWSVTPMTPMTRLQVGDVVTLCPRLPSGYHYGWLEDKKSMPRTPAPTDARHSSRRSSRVREIRFGKPAMALSSVDFRSRIVGHCRSPPASRKSDYRNGGGLSPSRPDSIGPTAPETPVFPSIPGIGVHSDGRRYGASPIPSRSGNTPGRPGLKIRSR